MKSPDIWDWGSMLGCVLRALWHLTLSKGSG